MSPLFLSSYCLGWEVKKFYKRTRWNFSPLRCWTHIRYHSTLYVHKIEFIFFAPSFPIQLVTGAVKTVCNQGGLCHVCRTNRGFSPFAFGCFLFLLAVRLGLHVPSWERPAASPPPWKGGIGASQDHQSFLSVCLLGNTLVTGLSVNVFLLPQNTQKVWLVHSARPTPTGTRLLLQKNTLVVWSWYPREKGYRDTRRVYIISARCSGEFCFSCPRERPRREQGRH